MASIPGRLELRGLRCSGSLGDPPVDAVLLVDVSVGLDLSAVAESDAYADTLDLADLAQTVRIAVATPRLLLETAAVSAARAVMQRYLSAREVEVRLCKPEPAGLQAAEEAISVRLAREVMDLR